MKVTEQVYNQDQWTEVITPAKNVFAFHFKEIWRYRDLIILFVKRDMAAQYRQTILGPLWHIIQPLLTAVFLMFLFSNIAGIPTDGIPHFLFYLTSVSVWNFFANCFTSASSTFVTNAAIFGKVYFPRLIVPIAIMLAGIVRFGLQFLLIIAFLLWYIFSKQYIFIPSWYLLLIPLIVSMMALMGLGCGIIVSALTARYRDLTILITFGLQLLMYATPVAYSLSYLETKGYASFIKYNPLSPLVEGFRFALFGKGFFSLNYFSFSILSITIILFCGIIIFNKTEKTFMDSV